MIFPKDLYEYVRILSAVEILRYLSSWLEVKALLER